MRTLLPFALFLAACGGPADPPARETNGAAAPPVGEPDNRIECAAAGDAAFARSCTIVASQEPRGRVLTIRKADGGFRRLLVTRDGQSVSAADGAERADARPLGGTRLEVSVGGDRFRLPLPLGR